MSRQIQIRRGTATENNNFTGAIGEVTMDTTNKTLRVHDGTTQGGNEIVSKNQFYSYITNCITEIPQDINLTLSGGTLTLKAGSKVYVPNGAGNFDVRTTANDMSATFSTNGTYLVGYSVSFNNITTYLSTISGNTESTTLTNGLAWYDTTNNVIKRAWAGSWQNSLFSLPICIVTVSGGQITSIDQVFNGFGYIGSTVFALPGVKGLIPNGRNTDGTLKNANLTTGSVLTVTVGTGTSTDTLRITNSALQRGSINYNSEFNYNYVNTFSSANIRSVAVIGSVSYVSGKITSLKTKTPFHSVDYSDSEYIANCAMPSDKYIDLTLGADGSTYTTPSDGYLYFAKISSASGQHIGLLDTTTGPGTYAYSSDTGQTLMVYLPVRKGQNIQIRYSAAGTTNSFRFIYANGAK